MKNARLYALSLVAVAAGGFGVEGSGGPAPPEPPAGCSPPTAGRVALWRAEGTAEDSVATHDGTLPNGGGFGPGFVGQAFDLPGQDDYVSVPDAPALNVTGDLTLETWVRIDDENFGNPDGTGVGGDRMIFWKTDQVLTDTTYMLWLEGDAPATAAATSMGFAQGNRQQPDGRVYSQDLTWAEDTWYHVAVTRSGSTISFFRDGVPVGSNTIGQTPVTTDEELDLGAAPENGTIYNPIDGDLDEAGIWSRALSAAEIKAIHETGTGACATPPPPPPSTISAPVAHIATPAITGNHLTFDASASTDVSRYRWDLTGDGQADVDCGNQPRMTTTVAKLERESSVLLEVDGRDGTSDTATMSVPRVGGAAVRARAAQLRTSQYADVVYCFGNVAIEDLTENGGPPPDCNFRVVAGLVEAHGCLNKVSTRAELTPDVIGAFRRAVEEDAELQAYLGGVIAGSAAVPSQNERVEPRTIDLQAALDLGEFYSSDKPVRINGVDFYPRKGTDIVISRALGYVIAENAGVRLEGALIRSGSVVLNVQEARGKVDVGDVDLTGQRPRIGGFPLSPQAHVTFIRRDARRISRIAAHVDLAGSGLTLDDGRSPVLDAEFIATNDEGLVESAVDGHLDRVRAGRWPVRDGGVAFRANVPAGKQCNLDVLGTGGLWTVAGDLLIGGLEDYGFKLTPPPFNGICFENGQFKSAGATLGPPILPVPVAPGVLLEEIGMNFAVNPSVLRGRAKLSGLVVFTLNGSILAAFPSSGAPFEFGPGDLPVVPDGFKGRFIDPVFGVGGTLSVRLPVLGTVDLVDAGFVYAYPAAIGFRAQLRGDGPDGYKDFLGILQFKADVQGAVNFENGRFNFVGNAEACVVRTACAGGIGVFSNVGVGACVKLEAFGESIQVGGGVQFPDKVFLWPLDGCKWTRFTEENVRAGAAQIQQSYPVTVAEAGQSQAIELRGNGAAPIVRVIGPDGETVELPAGANHVIGRRIRILRSPENGITSVGLQDPLAGTYRIERLPDSAAFSEIATALDPSGPNISAEAELDSLPRLSAASAARAGGRVTLRYKIRRRPAQTVTFLDRGRFLGQVRGGGRGVLLFTLPKDGRVHRIIARPALGGVTVPGEERVVARIRTRRPAQRRPSAVRARRRGARLVVRWRGKPSRYAVVVRERGGRTRARVTRRRVVRVRVSRTQAGVVAVRALDRFGRPGPARRARFRAVARARTRFLPYSVLRTRR